MDRALITGVDTDPARQALLKALPPDTDPCGERGEFHTFAYEGPMFAHSIPVSLGEVVTRDGFVFTDLLSD